MPKRVRRGSHIPPGRPAHASVQVEALALQWPRKRPNCSQPSMGTFETAAMPLGTSANFRPRDGEVTGNLKHSGTM
jgi:hypothetical protein